MLYPLSYEGGEAKRTAGDRRHQPQRLPFATVPDAKVLLVDDDPVILKLLQVNFEMEGYSVETASDGVEGLEKARTLHPDIVLLDIMMPRMDGLEVTKALKADEATKQIPIILLSAKAQASDIQAGKDIGADDYLTKPFDPLELLERVGDLLQGNIKHV